MDKIERQKIVERDEFDWDERKHIAMKSGNRCCHCGKKVYTNFGATVDHFIPLSKGGTNRDINMVMLCDKCNSDKKDKILYPGNYLEYLNEADKKKLIDYFESYTQSFEFVSRGNIFSCDEYLIGVLPPAVCLPGKRKKHNLPHIKFALKKARKEDADKLTQYYISVLKRFDLLDSEEAAAVNIDFWMRFGCIYYIENTEGIRYMVTVTLQTWEMGDHTEHNLMMTFFPKSGNDLCLSLTCGLLDFLPECLCAEQGLNQIPLRIRFFKDDKIGQKAFYINKMNSHEENCWLLTMTKFIVEGSEDTDVHKDPDYIHFCSKFGDIKKELEKWNKYHEEYDWMTCEVFVEKDQIEYV